jgi:hypothetical protein
MATARKTPKDGHKIPLELPLSEYFTWAAEQNDAAYQNGGEAYRSPMWEFVRLMAAHPDLKGCGAVDAFDRVSNLEVNQGERRLSWPELFPDSDDPETEFLATWDKVRVPAGQDILIYAAGLARDKPIKLRRPISEKYSLFVSIAAHLQFLRPGQYINLPVVRLADILKVDLRTVSYYTHRAITDGFLARLAKHHALSHQAAKYTFDCERFNMETGEEITPEESPHFHKEYKDYKDSKELKDSQDQRKTARTEEESERKKGLLGLKSDLERLSGQVTSTELSRKHGGSSSAERRKELQEQRRFLESKKTRN